MRNSWMVLMVSFGILFLGAAVLMSCTPYPMLPYYELDDAIANAETEDERQFHVERREHIHNEVIAADRFIRAYHICMADSYCIPVCEWQGAAALVDAFNFDKYDLSDIEKKYAWWRRVKNACKLYSTR